jgi:hypothetical protein
LFDLQLLFQLLRKTCDHICHTNRAATGHQTPKVLA